MKNFILRGDIFTVDLGKGVGSEHQGHKYCLVVQNDVGNECSTTTVIIPLSKSCKHMPTHVEIVGILPQRSYVLCEQIRVVDVKRLKNRVARLNSEQMLEVEQKIKLQLGIK